MVNIPKTDRKFCTHCVRYTDVKVSINKKGPARKNAQGERRYKRKNRGPKGQTKPILKRKAKTTKKVVLLLTCQECSKIRQKNRGRAKTVELGGQKKAKKNEALVY